MIKSQQKFRTFTRESFFKRLPKSHLLHDITFRGGYYIKSCDLCSPSKIVHSQSSSPLCELYPIHPLLDFPAVLNFRCIYAIDLRYEVSNNPNTFHTTRRHSHVVIQAGIYELNRSIKMDVLSGSILHIKKRALRLASLRASKIT